VSATIPVSTEARVFVAQLIRQLRQRERLGAHLLHAGASKWDAALRGLSKAMKAAGGPVKAGSILRSAGVRLWDARRQHAYSLAVHARRRSGILKLLTWEASPHPLAQRGLDGVVVRMRTIELQRGGCITATSYTPLAFFSWHALSRLQERAGGADLFADGYVIVRCGLAASVLRQHERYLGTELNFPIDDAALATGVLRSARSEDGKAFEFFDVLTVLPWSDTDRYARRHRQALAIATLVAIERDDRDPASVPIIEFHADDYVSRMLAHGIAIPAPNYLDDGPSTAMSATRTRV
jgi:hypothetical protein